MTSILNFSTQEDRDRLVTGTNVKKTFVSANKKVTYELGTDYACPRQPPYSYRSVVSVEDFDIDNLKLSVNTKNADPKKHFIEYKYNGENLNIAVRKILTANYGIQLPISKQFENIPPKYNTANLFFDKGLEMGSASANCTITMEFNGDSYLQKLERVFDQIREATAKFFLDGHGREILDDKFTKKLQKAKTTEDVIETLDFENILQTKMVKKDKTEVESKVKYFDLLTVYNKEKDSDVTKMAIKTHFFGLDSNGNTYDIHPSLCIRNKIEYSPIIFVQKAMFGQKYFRFKFVFNDVVIRNITQFGSSNPTPVAVSRAMFDLFLTEDSAAQTEEQQQTSKQIVIEQSDDEEVVKKETKKQPKGKKASKKVVNDSDDEE